MRSTPIGYNNSTINLDFFVIVLCGTKKTVVTRRKIVSVNRNKLFTIVHPGDRVTFPAKTKLKQGIIITIMDKQDSLNITNLAEDELTSLLQYDYGTVVARNYSRIDHYSSGNEGKIGSCLHNCFSKYYLYILHNYNNYYI